VAKADEAPREMQVRSAWLHGDDVVFHFVGIDDIAAAELLRDCEVLIPLAERRTLPAGEYYQSDLIGCVLIDALTMREVGVITEWHESSGPVEAPGYFSVGELLVPWVREWVVGVDLSARRLTMRLPNGYLEELA
jgi:16S rRNA processing protein RimM